MSSSPQDEISSRALDDALQEIRELFKQLQSQPSKLNEGKTAQCQHCTKHINEIEQLKCILAAAEHRLAQRQLDAQQNLSKEQKSNKYIIKLFRMVLSAIILLTPALVPISTNFIVAISGIFLTLLLARLTVSSCFRPV
jgi:hypothetical protein